MIISLHTLYFKGRFAVVGIINMERINIKFCRKLRKNQTDAENKLWKILRNRQILGVKFRRQYSAGKYIIDFYSPEYKIGIEADGGQHYESKGRQKDAIRTNELNKLGIKIIRFSDTDILKNIEGVYEVIYRTLAPHLNPLPGGERKTGTE